MCGLKNSSCKCQNCKHNTGEKSLQHKWTSSKEIIRQREKEQKK